jgi:type I site-specific restriction endonuclease
MMENAEQTEDVSSAIFMSRLRQFDIVRKKGDRKKEMEIRDIIKKDIRSLPIDAAGVREKQDKIDRALTSKFWDHIVLDPGHYLRIHIMPLMRFKKDVNFEESCFIDKCERLGLATLENNRDEVVLLSSSIGEMIEVLPQSMVTWQQKGIVEMALSDSFWEKVSYEDSRRLIIELAPLMKSLPSVNECSPSGAKQ